MRSQATWQRILFYILAYWLWLINIVVCIVALVELRSTVTVFWVMTGHSRWTLGLANQLSVLLGGLAMLVYVLVVENYYRRSAAQLYGLLRRFAWTMAIPIGVLLVSLLTRHMADSFSR